MIRSLLLALLSVGLLLAVLARSSQRQTSFRLATTRITLTEMPAQLPSQLDAEPPRQPSAPPKFTTATTPPPSFISVVPPAQPPLSDKSLAADPIQPLVGGTSPGVSVSVVPDFTPRVIISAGQLPLTPVLRSGQQPAYPEFAREHNLRGSVKVRLLVSEAGRVEDMALLEGDDRFGFVTAASRAVMAWQFEPLSLNGQPVAFYYIQLFQFKYDE